MKPQQEPSTQEVLAGLVERVTFHNAENGFCVLRLKARGHRDLITVIGHAAIISPGEWVTASGDWVNDHTHGQQFKARFMRTSAPTSIDGIEKYLGSGMIRGIGPVYAKKMVKAFAEKVFDIIEAEPDRLREVTGIGAVRAKRITDAWAEQKIVREIMVFLHSHGVGTARAVRIFKTYCDSAWNKDPVFGVIGIQTGPRELRVHSGFQDYGSRDWDVDCGNDQEDPPGIFCPGQADQDDLPGVEIVTEGRAESSPLEGNGVPLRARGATASEDWSVD